MLKTKKQALAIGLGCLLIGLTCGFFAGRSFSSSLSTKPCLKVASPTMNFSPFWLYGFSGGFEFRTYVNEDVLQQTSDTSSPIGKLQAEVIAKSHVQKMIDHNLAPDAEYAINSHLRTLGRMKNLKFWQVHFQDGQSSHFAIAVLLNGEVIPTSVFFDTERNRSKGQ